MFTWILIFFFKRDDDDGLAEGEEEGSVEVYCRELARSDSPLAGE